jgi:hypothetical protein
MHNKALISDDDMSDCEENPLIDEVSVVERRRKPHTNMRHRILFLTIVFLLLLSIHILIFNNVKIYGRREVEGWSHNTSRATTDYILPNENTTLIEPPTLCREPDPIFLLIVVCSSANNFEARQSIRESWGNTTEFNYPMFDKLHGPHNNSFLKINNKQWRKYAEVISYHMIRDVKSQVSLSSSLLGGLQCIVWRRSDQLPSSSHIPARREQHQRGTAVSD